MFLSIVIPTIGRPTLKRAIESVENQTIDTECIVIEDMQRWGAGPTRNFGIQQVKTKWVGFCDDDDELDENYAAWLYEAIAIGDFDMVIFKMKNQPNGGIPYTQDVDKLKYNEVAISFAMKTSLARKFPFNDMQGEDYDLITRIREVGYKILISQHIAYYLHGKDGTN